MKKVKVMLGAILLFAVVGGALAFKARNFQSFTFYKEDNAIPTPSCTIAVALFSTVDNVNGTLSATYSTTSSTGRCAGVKLIAAAQ